MELYVHPYFYHNRNVILTGDHKLSNADKTLHDKLIKSGVISDWRAPDVIRCAPVPLYNSYLDVFNLVERLKTILY